MCLAIPAKVVHIDAEHENALVAVGEIEKEISLALVDGISIGDYVLVHVGFAISVIDEAEAARVFAHLREIGELGRNAEPQT